MAQRTSRPKAKKRRQPRKRTPRGLIRPLAFLVTAGLVLTGLSLLLVLKLPSGPPPRSSPEVRPPAPPASGRATGDPSKAVAPPSRKSDRIYEEQRSGMLEQKIREIDLALLQALVASGMGAEAVSHQSVELRSRDRQQYPFQELHLDLAMDRDTFLARLQKELASWVESSALTPSPSSDREWTVSAHGIPTHRLILNGSASMGQQPPAAVPDARLVVIIDDLGENLASAQHLAGLGIPLTFSVLPGSTRTSEIVTLAGNHGLELLLHLPMQPMDPLIDPGPGALYVDMSPEEISSVLSMDLTQVARAVGVNNHMGSKFTGDLQGMRVVMQELARQGLFFVDSLTTPKSKARQTALSEGVPYLERHIFLDNEQDIQATLFQLRKAEGLALRQGLAIAIGHPYPTTLEALSLWASERDRRVRLISLGELVRSPATLRASSRQ